MGFCRRCGEIVVGERCRCGGTSAAPIVTLKKVLSEVSSQDKWTKTYVSSERSVSPARAGSVQSSVEALNRNTSNPPSPTKRFPRPLQSSNVNSLPLNNRVSQYIASTTSRPRSPLKQSVAVADPDSGILPSLINNTLSKVYGSVLQPKETLASYSCAICSTPFPPDATIYPDPSQHTPSDPRFVCRPCYEENGGSKGPCGACSRQVLTLKSEGGFVQAAGKYWHKRCFNCGGCSKNIGNNPMVDLMGRPCCAGCFDGCLKRDTPKKPRPSVGASATSSPNPTPTTPAARVGGLNKNPHGSKTRESSPAIEELEQRLGISRTRDSSPALEGLSQRLSTLSKDINTRSSPNSPQTPTRPRTSSRPLRPGDDEIRTASSPSRSSPVRRSTGSPAPTVEAIQEMKERLFRATSRSPPPARPSLFPSVPAGSRPGSQLFSSGRSSSSYSDLDSVSSPMPATPDLLSDFSDVTTQSSFSEPPDSPNGLEDSDSTVAIQGLSRQLSRYSRSDLFNALDDTIVEETNSQLNTPTKTPIKAIHSANTTPSKMPARTSLGTSPLRLKNSTPRRESTPIEAPSNCMKCGGKLFTVGNKGAFVTLQSSDKSKSSAEVYHSSCFTCSICEGPFESERKGQASFVRFRGKPCHPECAPKERITIHKSPSSPALRTYRREDRLEDSSPTPSPSRARSSTHRPSSSRFEQPALAAPANPLPAPRFGSRTVCPGCKKAVSPMERGVIPGPQGTKWHSACLVCGGKKVRPVSWYGVRKDENSKTPGCGKKLDSAAKSDEDGNVWCRECMLLLGLPNDAPPSPSKTPLTPTYTGSGKIIPQFTGATITRQFTGVSSSDATLLRQLTGNGMSRTRSISPTKQLGSTAATPGSRPRPKSVLGVRGAKSVDEGRGMFLVRQLTGASSTIG
ncbi:hypothetical protein FA15DRAFT_662562 [Coprinopsis marcescibilis]|uniref:LIM zinc-binding domain-containing protein n=1 Tax=Coprinopsis marcescibilis TaxID=230819 RepID=A0A5C3LEK8_COPMA|nr:hypothetical protein FA15DRAFT_662562 [Coprinopsis marcescibilis]